MQLTTLIMVLAAIGFATYMAGWWRAAGQVNAAASGGVRQKLHSLPTSYGYYALLWSVIPALTLLALWSALSDAYINSQVIASLPESYQELPGPELNLIMNDVRNIASGNIASAAPNQAVSAAAAYMAELRATLRQWSNILILGLAIIGGAIGFSRVTPERRARSRVEQATMVFLIAASSIAILTTIGIVASVLFESIRFFQKVPVTEFLFGLTWSPQTAIRADQVGSSGSFGAIPLFAGTLMISGIAMLVAVPVGLMVAIFLSEYAPARVRDWVKPVLEILAGIPTVVYGYFAALTVGPFFRELGLDFGFVISSEAALTAGLVMGIMIIPFVSSLSDDVIRAVPQAMRDGSYGLGATRSETIKKVVFPAALPGIVGGILLAVSRAIGETMIVVMAAGLSANLTANPFEAVTTVTVQIVTLLVGDQEFDSAKTLAAFGLGLTLFVVTLGLNVIALHVVRKYREAYD